MNIDPNRLSSSENDDPHIIAADNLSIQTDYIAPYYYDFILVIPFIGFPADLDEIIIDVID